MRVLCPRGHSLHRWTSQTARSSRAGQHHGLSWGFAGNLGISCIRARCRKCKYDGSTDYAVLCAELAAAVRGRVIYL